MAFHEPGFVAVVSMIAIFFTILPFMAINTTSFGGTRLRKSKVQVERNRCDSPNTYMKMAWYLLSAILLVHVSGCLAQHPYFNYWKGGFQGTFDVAPTNDIDGWTATLTFTSALDTLQVFTGIITDNTDDTTFTVTNQVYNGDVTGGDTLTVHFLGEFSSDLPPDVTVEVTVNEVPPVSIVDPGNTLDLIPNIPIAAVGPTSLPDQSDKPVILVPTLGIPQPPSTGSTMKYDYGNALGLSILFYYAQRSGRLPFSNPITWRGDSALEDGQDVGIDLSGGWYDGGDHVKFTFPMAYSTWVLAWGFLKFKDGYAAAGQTQMMCDNLKWPLDYFMKSKPMFKDELYVQVGDAFEDHSYWGRAENMNLSRPSFKIDKTCKGSDVAAATAAALAAGNMVFRDICGDYTYSTRLLTAARSIYGLAKENRGFYSQCVNEAAAFYGSNSYQDDLAVAASLLHMATKRSIYLNDAKSFHISGNRWAFYWDDVMAAADVMLYEITKEDAYKTNIENFLNNYLPGGLVPQTPCGLAYRDQWGPNRYAANAAFIATIAADNGIQTNAYTPWAMSQINYLLGDNRYNISYEIGFGTKFPTRPYHRNSACALGSKTCSIGDPGPNPNVLLGALVGGPDNADNYRDRRDDYVKNAVACDINAGFQGALAGLYQFAQNGALPPAPRRKC